MITGHEMRIANIVSIFDYVLPLLAELFSDWAFCGVFLVRLLLPHFPPPTTLVTTSTARMVCVCLCTSTIPMQRNELPCKGVQDKDGEVALNDMPNIDMLSVCHETLLDPDLEFKFLNSKPLKIILVHADSRFIWSTFMHLGTDLVWQTLSDCHVP